MFAQVHKIREAERAAAFIVAHVRAGDGDEALRLGEGQRLQQDGVHHAEDGGVGADTDGQGENGHGGEARAFRQHAERVTQILPHGVHELVLHPSSKTNIVRARFIFYS